MPIAFFQGHFFHVRLAIKSRATAAAVLLISAGMAGAYAWLAVRAYRAWHLAQSGGAALEHAIALEPSNSEYLHARGVAALFGEQDAQAAIADFQRALQLNPYQSRYWLDLGAAWALRGDTAQQKAAVEAAVDAEPMNPALSWEAANLMLVSGDLPAALRMFRVNLQTDPENANAVFEICWRATQDADRILQEAVPPTAEAHLQFLQFLVRRGEVDAAAKTWESTFSLGQDFDGKLALPYVNFLLQQQQAAEALQVWQEIVDADEHLKPYVAPGNLVINGHFDSPLLNSGLDWRITSNPAVRLSLDAEQFHGSGRSLAFTFTGDPVGDTGVYQYIPVEPESEYQFSGYVKTEEIYTASGPRLVLQDAYNRKQLLTSEELVGTLPWKQVRGTFRTGAQTMLLALRVVQSPTAHIKGSLWIGDLALTRR